MASFIPKMKIVGIGGSGCNTVFRMYKIRQSHKQSSLWKVKLAAFNADVQDLEKGKADEKLWIGRTVTQGLGTGMNPDIGKKAAQEQSEEIEKMLRGLDAVFLVGGEGGGTYTGAAPHVASIAKKLGILTVAVATYPFAFEGAHRESIAKAGLEELRGRADSTLVIYNENLLGSSDTPVRLEDAFASCDMILHEAIKGMFDVMIKPGILQVNFSDIRALLKKSGSAMFGSGEGSGEERSSVAVQRALHSPLLKADPQKAHGVLLTVSGGNDMSLHEVQQVAELVKGRVAPGASLVFGATYDTTLKKGVLRVSLILTGV